MVQVWPGEFQRTAETSACCCHNLFLGSRRTDDAGLDDDAQRGGLHVVEAGRLRRKLHEVWVQLRRRAHAQVGEVRHAVLHAAEQRVTQWPS